MRLSHGMLLLTVLLGLAGSAYGEEPAPDAYDTALASFCQAAGQRVQQKQDIRGGAVLEDIKRKLGESLLRYRQYRFPREKVNVLTYKDSAGATDGLNKIRALAGGRSIAFANDATLVEIVYSDLRDGVHLCGYLQDSQALKAAALAAQRGVHLVKVIGAQEADVLRISQSLNLELLEVVNSWCTINGRALQLNYLRLKQARKPDDVRDRFAKLGAEGKRLLVIDDMVVEIVGQDVTETDIDATRRALVPSALSTFMDRIVVAHGQILGVTYPP
jgi:hypothetical protein